MNTNMQELKADRTWLEGTPRPLRTMRMALELQALAVGYKLHDEKTED
jgi:hypothetical protein